MNEKWSRGLLAVEAVLIGLPITYLVGIMAGAILWFATVGVFQQPDARGLLAHLQVVLDPGNILVLSVAVSVAAFWRLLFAAIRGGRLALIRVGRLWWWVASWGLVVLGAALVSNNLPPSVPYSSMASFREFLNFHALGLPLLVPFAHLLYETRRARRTA